MSEQDVEKAEKGANTHDVELKARAVLRHWKKMKGRDATRDILLDALGRCRNEEAKLKLQNTWMEAGKINIQILRF